ncbi:MAG: NAD(P)H-dependent oxidoreductase subunit E [Firmicutes bacterium]|nr:NAD(P)H-dependent oxidoreductase subunit E [Bacillota bacterium]
MSLIEGEEELIRTSVSEVLHDQEMARENLIPILLQVQEKLNYLPPLAMELIAAALAIPAVDIFGLTTFYNQFRLHPPGKYQLQVCMGTACYMVGGKIALDCFERRLGIGEGETTPDREFSLERVACVGCCTMAPVVVVNEQVEGRVTPTRVDGILIGYGKEIKASTGIAEKKGEEGS